jgi:hypothetical protein
MNIKEGDIFKSTIASGDFIVKRIVNNMVILESQDGKRQIITGVETLKLKSFYLKKEDEEL